jgi:hypothetical protein
MFEYILCCVSTNSQMEIHNRSHTNMLNKHKLRKLHVWNDPKPYQKQNEKKKNFKTLHEWHEETNHSIQSCSAFPVS